MVGGRRAMAESSACFVVTSQSFRSLDSSFEGSVSEYKLCALLCGLSVFKVLQYYYLLYNYMKTWKSTFIQYETFKL